MTVRSTPEGYHSVTPYLIVDDPQSAIDFYIAAFGGVQKMKLMMGDTIAHAEVLIGDSHIMLSGEWPDMGAMSPKSRGGATASFMIYVPDVDAAFDRAIAAGGTVDKPVELQFYGDRSGTLVDPFGHKWTLATHVEDVSEEEGQRRMEAMMGG